ADIILLLISAYFVQSDYCYTTELQRALERHRLQEARVVPVFVRPCEWDGLDFAHLQGLPEDAKPITTHSDRELIWTQVVRGIKRLAVELQGDRRAPTSSATIRQPAPEAKYDSSAYLRSLVAWRRNAFGPTREIPIYARFEGRTVVINTGLADW